MYICCNYIPPPNSKVLRDVDFDFFEEIETNIEQYCTLWFTFIEGDLNSRTGLLYDLLEYNKHLDDYNNVNTNSNELNFGHIPTRMNEDHMTDSQGRALISMCKSSNHIIANGRIPKDKAGNYTFTSPRGLSVTDYSLIHHDSYNRNVIHEFEILDWTEFSDHAGLYFSFLTEKNVNIQNNKTETKQQEVKIIFDNDKSQYKEV